MDYRFPVRLINGVADYGRLITGPFGVVVGLRPHRYGGGYGDVGTVVVLVYRFNRGCESCSLW